MFEHCEQRRRRQRGRRRKTEQSSTISSPCEPNGLDELIKRHFLAEFKSYPKCLLEIGCVNFLIVTDFEALLSECTRSKLFGPLFIAIFKKVQVGKDQEKAQSERDSHSKNRGGKKPN